MSKRAFGLVVLGALGVVVVYGCGSSDPAAEFPPGGGDVDAAGNSSGGFGPQLEGGDPEAAPRALCGNSVKDPGETCDDGNATAGDGCGVTCLVEPGYKCGSLGAACTATACGDGIVAGDEDCDDGNMAPNDGCSATCVFEPGFYCPNPGKSCVATTCGDKAKQGSEQCDDGNLRPYDGCSPTCTIEPKCAGGSCTAVCGDGIKFPGEACDDGNVSFGRRLQRDVHARTRVHVPGRDRGPPRVDRRSAHPPRSPDPGRRLRDVQHRPGEGSVKDRPIRSVSGRPK